MRIGRDTCSKMIACSLHVYIQDRNIVIDKSVDEVEDITREGICIALKK